MTVAFTDRVEAGRRLAELMVALQDEDVVVLGLPRGGVPVAAEIAAVLDAPLDVIVVRKLGVPYQPELGMGAVGEDGARVLNPEVIKLSGVTQAELASVEARELKEVRRRAGLYRGALAKVPLEGKVAVVVDDGVATGSTASAACRIARARGAAKVVLAVPVAAPGWDARLSGDADEFVCVATPDPFFAIGQFYADFSQTSDVEVAGCLARSRGTGHAVSPAHSADAAAGTDGDERGEEVPAMRAHVRFHVGAAELAGSLILPRHAPGVVAFVHGSGSSRHSPRNRYVASVLNEAGLGTLLFDLLTSEEELDRSNVFNIELLAGRLADATDWLRSQPGTGGLPIGYFGASTGAAAALWAAADDGRDIAAVVSRGGRPDLASAKLGLVRCPTLLIVGGRDDVVLELNRQAQAELRCPNELAVVPGASHLFEEPGTLDQAAALARDWLVRHLTAGSPASRSQPDAR